MIITSSEQIAGMRVVKTVGLVRGSTIRARHLGRDLMALLRNLVGGEISEYTKLMAESREQSIKRMTDEAESLGANAVISARFTTSMIMSGAAELLIYGTAVVIEETD
ncbi:MAG: YbjQ family protein [Chloroflexi bacterium]|nr:YbjQ family protein [Chloroflexota bacterium]